MICYLDCIGNLIKGSVSHTESFLILRSAFEERPQKGGEKKSSFLPKQQRSCSHYYLVSLFWVVSPDRELVSYNSVITLSNSPSTLALFRVAQSWAQRPVCLVPPLRASSWNEMMPTDFQAISFPLWKFLFSYWIDSLSETWPLL